MNYTILKQWKTLDGTYHSATEDYHDYDSAIGNFHNKFRPMQNDENVATFRFMLFDEYGIKIETCGWTRKGAEHAEKVTE